MKKCPVCKAELAENAGFCIYCMTSLEGKTTIDGKKSEKKRWPIFLVALLVIVLIALVIWLAGRINTLDSVMGQSTTGTSASSTSVNGNGTTTSMSDATASTSGATQQGTTADGQSGGAPVTGTTEAVSPSTTTTTATTTYPKFTTTETIAPVEIEYEYREATPSDVYPAESGLKTLSGPTVVITGVKTASPDGVYVVPEYIDGKMVGAIMSEAFCNPDICLAVREIVLPRTVRSIWPNAFRDCYNMTELYTKAPVICIYENAFARVENRTGTLTIHAADDCRTYNYYLYREIADNYYDAVFQKWNG